MNKEENKHEGIDRYIILGLVMLVVAGIMIYTLASLQLVHGKQYKDQTKSRINTTGVIYPKRGDIYDRNGVPIAGSRMGYCAEYVDVKMSDKDKNAMLLDLIRVLEKNGKKIKSRLTNIMDVNPVRFKIDEPKNFISGIVLSNEDAQFVITAEQAYRYMKEKTFDIDPAYSEADAFKIMQLRYEILMSKPTIQQPMVLAEDITNLTMAELEERSQEFQGVSTFVKPYREYYDPQVAAHVLGYVGSITEEDYKEWSKTYPEKYYSLTDTAGVMGIEWGAESLLRGVNGISSKEVDETGRTTSLTIERPPVQGNDIYLTIDLELQKVAVNALKAGIDRIKNIKDKKNFGDANAGAVVVMDVNTGEVLAMASYPDFDPNAYLKGDSKAISLINANKDYPLWNRATLAAYPPGSTYKPLVAVAALESGVITPETKINCPYKWENDNWVFTNLEGNQGNINLSKALETSSNMFFYKVGVKTGIDNIVYWAKQFGFAQKTQIELSESEGSIASKEYKKTYFDESWVSTNTAMAAIGQLYNNFTPIQIVNYISTIANDGKLFTPHLIKMGVSEKGEIVYEPEEDFKQIPAKQSTLDAVQKGMIAVTNHSDGTAADVFKDFPFFVAGKTGTSETGNEANKESSHGLFVCYAPYDKPQIAIAVVVEHGVWGAYTAPIAKEIMAAYFELNENKTDNSKDKQAVEILW